MYVTNSRPNGWTDWADIFVNIQGWPGGVSGQKKFKQNIFLLIINFFSKEFFLSRVSPCPSVCYILATIRNY